MRRHCKAVSMLLAVFLLAGLLSPCTPVRAAAGVITWPAGAKIIESRTFYGDQSLDSVVIPENVEEIHSEAFADSSLREITLPSTITFIDETAFTGSNLSAVHVDKDPNSYAYNWMRDHGYLAEYRALLIGEKTFLHLGDMETETVLRNAGDAGEMGKMLGRVYGPAGIRYTVTKKTDLSYGGILSAIQNTFEGSREQDVSLFFIATHGNTASDGDLLMSFTGDPNDEEAVAAFRANQFLSFETLASWLTTYVKGRVIVILESCGSGSAIYSADEPEDGAKGTLFAGRDSAALRAVAAETQGDDTAFAGRAVEVFGKADPGITVMPPEGNTSPAGGRKTTGSFRQPKFYVLAASAHGEDSYGYLNDAPVSPLMNFFTLWLIQGIGRAGNSPADQIPKDGLLTLQELFVYINRNGRVNGQQIQHVQCYHQNSEFVCFLLQ